MRHSLPVISQPDPIDRIEISIPCDVAWDGMVGDERVRHCGECRQNVYNIAAMTRPDALRLLETTGGQVCVRIFRRPDGTVVTADCRERLRAARRRGLHVFLGVLAIVIVTQLVAQLAGLLGKRPPLGIGDRAAAALAGEPVPAPDMTVLGGTPPLPYIEGKPAPMPLAGKPVGHRRHRMGKGHASGGGATMGAPPAVESKRKRSLDDDLQGLLSL